MNKEPELDDYDIIIAAFSGGKDSVAGVLHLRELGVDLSKVELWHHEVDGREGQAFMDWPCTVSYCNAFAEWFGTSIYASWKEGGFEREMLRKNTPTAPTWFEHPASDGIQLATAGGRSKRVGTRLKFPQVSVNKQVRWCSSYLKSDVGSIALNNQKRLHGKRVLLCTFERGEESAARSRYAPFSVHGTNSGKKTVHHWRPLLQWTEDMVWDIIGRYQVHAHPAYYLGWSRTSCAGCIFGGKKQFASFQKLFPDRMSKFIQYEESFGWTMKRDMPLDEFVKGVSPYEMEECYIQLALSDTWDTAIQMDKWILPKGAYSKGICGPT